MRDELFGLINSLINVKNDHIIDTILSFFKKHKLGDIDVSIKDEKIKVKFDKSLQSVELKYLVESLFMKHFQAEKIIELKVLSETDDVTSCFNQRKLFTDLDELIHKSSRDNSIFSVLFIDVDKFKVVNDLFGHLVGSTLLADIAVIIRNHIQTPYFYRYGGDEFVLFIDKVGGEKVLELGNIICQSIKDASFKIENHGEYKLSVSIGICEFPTDASNYKEVIEIADKMMYESKNSGRGRVAQYRKSSEEVS
jgi:diguanylate cyclase (GGDEF)-like protein